MKLLLNINFPYQKAIQHINEGYISIKDRKTHKKDAKIA
jgi:hypothetical protein